MIPPAAGQAPGRMTLRDLATKLDERAVCLNILQGAGPNWVVWLYAADDPSVLFTAEGDVLEAVVFEALAQWDQLSKSEPPASDRERES